MAKDFLNIEHDLYIDPQTGDFAFGEADNEHIEDVLVSFPGDYKQFPYIGVAISDFLQSPMDPQTVANLERKIKLNLEASGATDINAKVNSIEEINISAKYD